MPDAPAAFARLLTIIQRLRSPDGCPWDREQSPRTLRAALLEEAWECVSAIDNADDRNMEEELGDLYLLVTMMAWMKEEEGTFTVESALAHIADKLVRRHPHVFAGAARGNAEQVLVQWDAIKAQEKADRAAEGGFSAVEGGFSAAEGGFSAAAGGFSAAAGGFSAAAGGFSAVEGRFSAADGDFRDATVKHAGGGAPSHPSSLDGVPASFPPLERAAKLQKKAAKAGFDWPGPQPVWDKIEEELGELRDAVQADAHSDIEAELGDILFSVVNLARLLRVDPALALHRTNMKFERRFREVERRLAAEGATPVESGLDRMDALWNQVKAEESASGDAESASGDAESASGDTQRTSK
jgi:uncharacterized protein YabN with tetrapyrrole methylase and pyrophosphatase domain